jgi:hypothetical protein
MDFAKKEIAVGLISCVEALNLKHLDIKKVSFLREMTPFSFILKQRRFARKHSGKALIINTLLFCFFYIFSKPRCCALHKGCEVGTCEHVLAQQCQINHLFG